MKVTESLNDKNTYRVRNWNMFMSTPAKVFCFCSSSRCLSGSIIFTRKSCNKSRSRSVLRFIGRYLFFLGCLKTINESLER